MAHITEQRYAIPSVQGGTDTFRVLFAAPSPGTPKKLFVFCHGGGYTADSFTLLLQRLAAHYATDSEVVHAIAYDARAHGQSRMSNESEDEAGTLSLQVMREDFNRVLMHHIETTYGQAAYATISLLLVGHSMGGPVAVDAALHGDPIWTKAVNGIAVIDVVEGSALEALVGMQTMVASRPSSFTKIDGAIRWAMQSHSVHHLPSAKISVPSQLVEVKEAVSGQRRFRWRTDLQKTAPHWEGWFKDLSSKFLQVPAAKLLILANTDRLDKPLTIAQMQGKFRMEIVTDPRGTVGHAVHEDEPEKTAAILIDFAAMCSAVKRVPMVGGGYKIITMGHTVA